MSISFEEYDTKLRLPEQARDEELLIRNKHHILCYEPGKGKSMPIISCINKINKMKNGKAKVLIMSDATCIKDMWKKEIVPMKVLPKETYMVTDRTAIGKVKDAILATKWDIIVCDECQSLRSGVTRAKSKYAKLVYQLCSKTEYVWGMTGTIAGNNDIEPFCVLHALHVAGMGKINCRSFKRIFCKNELQYGPFGAFEKPVGLNEKGKELMSEAYKNGCSFWEYSEEDEMPDLIIENKIFNVEKTEEYENALEGILSCGEYESTVIKAIAAQKAQQALNGFLYYEDTEEDSLKRKVYFVKDFDNPKLDYVIKRCKEKIQIVTYRFQEDGNNIKVALSKNKIRYTEDISDFKKLVEEGNHVILVIQCARGKAANIQVCQDIIYYTADFSFINYKQMIHRCWRRGQKEPCRVTFLINDPGDKYKVEKKIWDSLIKKKNIHDLIMSIKNEEV